MRLSQKLKLTYVFVSQKNNKAILLYINHQLHINIPNAK